MNGYEIIGEVKKQFLYLDGRYEYYQRYKTVGDEEVCLDWEIASAFDKSKLITQYSMEEEHFDGGPGYEATVIFIAWTDNIGTLHTSSVLTECM